MLTVVSDENLVSFTKIYGFWRHVPGFTTTVTTNELPIPMSHSEDLCKRSVEQALWPRCSFEKVFQLLTPTLMTFKLK